MIKTLYCSVIEQLGAKHLVMQYLVHEDPNVRYEALIAVQKLMVHNWYVILHSHCMILDLTNGINCRLELTLYIIIFYPSI